MLRDISMPGVVMANPALALPIAAADAQAEILEREIDALESDLHILTATERGIARREKILGITPLDTDTPSERAYRVRVKWHDIVPYTRRELIARLTRLVGDGQFTFLLDLAARTLKVRVELTSKKQAAAIAALVEEIVPLDIVTDVRIRYRQWDTFAGQRWQDFDMSWMDMASLAEEEY
jgi:hypothetical protein